MGRSSSIGPPLSSSSLLTNFPAYVLPFVEICKCRNICKCDKCCHYTDNKVYEMQTTHQQPGKGWAGIHLRTRTEKEKKRRQEWQREGQTQNGAIYSTIIVLSWAFPHILRVLQKRARATGRTVTGRITMSVWPHSRVVLSDASSGPLQARCWWQEDSTPYIALLIESFLLKVEERKKLCVCIKSPLLGVLSKLHACRALTEGCSDFVLTC